MLRAAVVVFAALSTGGCALTTDRIHIDYAPDAPAALDGADRVHVAVTVVDTRTIRDKVSCKKNGYGIEMAPIVADHDVGQTLAEAIRTELRNRRFNVGDRGVVVRCELQRFYNDFKLGFFSGDALAEVAMNVQVQRPEGMVVFVRSFLGQGKEPNIQLTLGHNAKAALDRALKDAVSQLVNDREFVDALLHTPGPEQTSESRERDPEAQERERNNAATKSGTKGQPKIVERASHGAPAVVERKASILPQSWNGSLQARVRSTSSSVPLRADPSPFATAIGEVRSGTNVAAQTRQGSWIEVTTSDGKHGFLPATCLEMP